MDPVGSIWNRVILLVAGFIIGWNLSNYWTVAESQISRQRYRLVIGVVMGLAMLVWLGISSLATAIFGLVIVLFTAFVAYAGSAREASGTPDPLPRPRPERRGSLLDDVLVVLACHGESENYDGPDSWARHLAWLADRDGHVPSWFARPRVYAQIRKAVGLMDETSSLDGWVTLLCGLADEELGAGYTCSKGYSFVRPGLPSMLAHAAEDGHTRFVIVALGTMDKKEISQAVTESRIKEVGVQVSVLVPPEQLGWDEEYAVERLQGLMRGETSPAPSTLTSICAEQISELVREESSRRRWA